MNNISSKTAIIIGGGISGAATAYSLAKRGYNITLYEKNSSLAQEGSGNYQGLLYGTFHGNYIPLTELHVMGLHYSTQLIKSILKEGHGYQQTGLIQLFSDEIILAKNIHSIQKNYAQFKNNYNESKTFKYFENFCDIARSTELKQGSNAKHGIYFPNSMWLHPQNFIHKLVNNPNIKVILDSEITNLQLNKSNGKHIWQLLKNNQIIDESQTVILCNAHAIKKFSVTKHLDLMMIRGQTTRLKGKNKLSTPICNGSYILPESNGYFTIGASFKPNNHSTQIKDEEHLENIKSISNFYPDIIAHEIIDGHAAIRSSTKDYLPLVGPIADYNNFMKINAKLALDKNLKIYNQCPNLPGLYLNIAHGSKGLVTAPISGEIIANLITQEKPIANERLTKAIAPNRLYLNQIIKPQKK